MDRLRPAEATAYYVLIRWVGLRFLVTDGETLSSSSCPHAATLFTSYSTADRLASQILREMPEASVSVMTTKTHAPNVLRG